MVRLAVGIGILMLLMSCRTQKIAMREKVTGDVPPEILTSGNIMSMAHPFETMKVRTMNVDFMFNGVSDNFKAKMAIERDSFIVVSVIPLLGYEAVRIYCTRDSIYILNRTDKTYIASSVDHYLAQYNVQAKFTDLQAILVNEAFVYSAGMDQLQLSENLAQIGDVILLTLVSEIGEKDIFNQTITAGRDDQKIRTVLVKDYQQETDLFISYADFQRYDSVFFPGKIFINIKEKNHKINLAIEYGQIIFNEPVSIPIDIPKSYSRIIL
jgi:hypothetical protein